jgi:hypothetical protein
MQFFSTAAASSSGSSCALRALAPIIHTSSVAIAAAAGATPVDLFAGTAGTSAPYSGFVSATLGCTAYQLVVSYVVGDDCVDACDPVADTLSTVDVTINVPAGQGVQLPEGFIAKITVATTDGATPPVLTATAIGGTVSFTSSRAGVCSGDVLVP